MNVLILAAGTRNKIIQYFKKAFQNEGKVFAADASPFSTAIYEADQHFIVPRITEPGYIDVILDICKKEKVDLVLTLIDPELSLLAANTDKFAAVGTKVLGSSYELCEMSLDKYQTFLWLTKHGYKCGRCWLDKDELFKELDAGTASFPLFVKPENGSASIGINQAHGRETIDYLFSHSEGLMVQELYRGQEIGADVYIDMISGEVVSIFTKKKIVMRAGETDKSVSFKDPALFALIERFVKEAGYRGQIDIDLFEENGEYAISEINPRFGGGYPHAYECGCDHMKLILNNLKGIANEKKIGDYEEGVYMMKYSELKLLRDADIQK